MGTGCARIGNNFVFHIGDEFAILAIGQQAKAVIVFGQCFRNKGNPYFQRGLHLFREQPQRVQVADQAWPLSQGRQNAHGMKSDQFGAKAGDKHVYGFEHMLGFFRINFPPPGGLYHTDELSFGVFQGNADVAANTLFAQQVVLCVGFLNIAEQDFRLGCLNHRDAGGQAGLIIEIFQRFTIHTAGQDANPLVLHHQKLAYGDQVNLETISQSFSKKLDKVTSG